MKYLLRYIPPIVVGSLIFVITCLIKPDTLPGMPKGIPWDKIAHFGMFFMLSAVIMYEYYRIHKNSISIVKWLFWGFIIPISYGGVIELLQEFFFVYRGAEWGDFIADAAGSFAATLLAIIIPRTKS